MSNNIDFSLIRPHLLPKEVSAIEHSSFSIDDFFEGVNLKDEKGKVWNVRFAISEGIDGIFMRAHSSDSINAQHLTYKQKNQQEASGLTNRAGSIWFSKYYYLPEYTSDHLPEYIGCRSGDYSNESLNEIASSFSELIAKGKKVEEKLPPKTTKEVANHVREFFKSCPELIPEVEKPLPKVTPKPDSAQGKTSESSRLFLKVIEGLGAVFLLYLVACYAQNFWKTPSVA